MKHPDALPFPPQPDETLDDLIIGGMSLLQSRKGYRFSIDAVLLAMWLEASKAHYAVELGTGSGVISLLLAHRYPQLRIDALELQPAMAARAQRNVWNNAQENCIRVLEQDIRQLSSVLPSGQCDLVYSNPPFFRQGEGVVSSHPEKAIARHELCLKLAEIVQAASYLLRPRGKLAIILNAQRLPELVSLLTETGFALCRLRMIHPSCHRPATMLLAEAWYAAHTQTCIEPPLILYQPDGSYTEEVLRWYTPDTI